MSDDCQIQVRPRANDSSLRPSQGLSALIARGRRDATLLKHAAKSDYLAGVLDKQVEEHEQEGPDIIPALKRNLETRKKARQQLFLDAENGDPDAQFRVGWWYISGQNGEATDLAEALKWFRMAAEEGHAGAQFALGTAYKLGAEGAPDYVLAYKWLCLSAARTSEDCHAPTRAANLNTLAAEMTPAQIAEAQRLAVLFEEERRKPIPDIMTALKRSLESRKNRADNHSNEEKGWTPV